jgi:hypothetical protein
MIKLRSLIKETWDVVVGSINVNGEIRSEETQSSHTELRLTGKRWRYNQYNYNVYWSGNDSEHDDNDELSVERHLEKKYGYKVKSHISLGSVDREGFQNNWMIAHGHKL